MSKLTQLRNYCYYSILLLLPIQLNYYFWPHWSYVLGRKSDYLSPVFYALDILIIAFLLLWIVSKNPYRIISKTQIILSILFIVSILLNIYFSSVPVLSLLGWIMIIKYLLFIAAAYQLRVSMVKSMYFLILGGCFASIVAVLQIFHQGSIGGLLYYAGERTFTIQSLNIAKEHIVNPFTQQPITILRAYATFPHPNVFAGYLLLILLLLTRHKNEILKKLKSFWFQDTVIRVIYWCTYGLLFSTLLLTFSKTAILAYILGIFWLLNIRIRYKVMVVLLLSFSLVILTWQSVIILPYNESIEIRKLLNYAAVHLFSSFPLTGAGMKHFMLYLPLYSPYRTIYFLQPVHNMYLLMISELGILLFMTVFAAIVVYIKSIRKNFHHTSLYILLPFLFIGLNDHYLYTLHQGLLVMSLSIVFFLLYQKK